jgi:hypothetical protein
MALRNPITNMWQSDTEAALAAAKAQEAELAAQLEQTDADEALIRTDHKLGKLTTDEAATKFSLLKSRRDFLLELAAVAAQETVDAQAAENQRLFEKEREEKRKIAREGRKSLEQRNAAGKKALAKIEPLLAQLATALDEYEHASDAANTFFPHETWQRGFIKWLLREAVIASDLGPFLDLHPPHQGGSYVMIGNEKTYVPGPEIPEFKGIVAEFDTAAGEALHAYDLARGLVAVPLSPPVPRPAPVFTDATAAKRRATAELARMSRQAGLATPLDITAAGGTAPRQFDPATGSWRSAPVEHQSVTADPEPVIEMPAEEFVTDAEPEVGVVTGDHIDLRKARA